MNIPDNIQMIPVESSQIASIGRDPETNELYIRFARGSAEYVYQHVSEDLFNDLKNAKSVGTFFGNAIKSQPAKHPYKRL